MDQQQSIELRFISTSLRLSVIKCKDPGEKENAYKDTTSDSDPYNCGTQLTFHCRHGYQMYGNSTLICGEDGYFKIPMFHCAKTGKPYINFSSLNDNFCIMTSYLLLDSFGEIQMFEENVVYFTV